MRRIFLASLLCLPTSLSAEIAHQFFLTAFIDSLTVDDLADPRRT